MAEKEKMKAKEKKEERPKASTATTNEKTKTATKVEPKKPIKEKIAPKKQKSAQQGDAKQVADAFDVVKFVLMTEKSIRMVESQNKLVFIVSRGAKKNEIRKSIEHAFGSPVSGVTTVIDQSGRKKAFVKFSNPGAAGDIAIKLGVI